MSKLATEEENVALGNRLAALRDTLKLSQVEFSQRLNLSPRAYQNYERGERETPASVIKAIYDAFTIDPLWILAGPGLVPLKADIKDNPDLLEQIVIAVEHRLARTRRRLDPDKKGHLVKLLYLQLRDKQSFDLNHLNEMVALAA